MIISSFKAFLEIVCLKIKSQLRILKRTLGLKRWMQDLDLQATLDWLAQIHETLTAQLPYLAAPGAFWPRLFITPNSAGRQKPDQWLVSQGNKALMLFEEAVGAEAARRGIEHLGTWNMSIQSTKYDGV